VRPYLPAVVKIGPRWLIEQEWRAYQFWVERILPDIARLEGSPILGRQQGILRYALVGSGIFPVQSLYDYYKQHDAEAIRRLLAERLFKVLGQQYWQARQPDSACRLGTEYDAVLPVNLLLRFEDTDPLAAAHHIDPKHLPPSIVQIGDNIQLKGFVITEIDLPEKQLTLNLPPTSGERAPFSAQVPSGYRLRLIDVPHIEQYRAGQTLDSIRCQVTATRHKTLAETVKRIVPDTLNLAAETLPLSTELHLPNPLLAYPDILNQNRSLYRATVHGDLNMENILIDTETDILSLIDFATVRRGHNLHDLLRLEICHRPAGPQSARFAAPGNRGGDQTVAKLSTSSRIAAANPALLLQAASPDDGSFQQNNGLDAVDYRVEKSPDCPGHYSAGGRRTSLYPHRLDRVLSGPDPVLARCIEVQELGDDAGASST
jgi:hypothetical protein